MSSSCCFFTAVHLATLKYKMITLSLNTLFLVNLKPDVFLNYYSIIIGLGVTLALFPLKKESVFENDTLHICCYFQKPKNFCVWDS